MDPGSGQKSSNIDDFLPDPGSIRLPQAPFKARQILWDRFAAANGVTVRALIQKHRP